MGILPGLDFSRPNLPSLKLWALGIAVSVILAGAQAGAQEPYDFAQSEETLVEADTLDYDEKNDVVAAEGNVEIARGSRVLLADKLIYDRKSGVVTARGNVKLMEPTGEVVFADSVVLSDDLKRGVIHHISVRMEETAKLAAQSGKRRSETLSQFQRAVFTPCEVCAEEGDRTPLWQLKAYQVIHDKEAQEIAYQDVFFEFFGVPVAYLPYFSHPDPTVKRKSGFLTPEISSTTEIGAALEVPYYWAIAPNYDLTVAPVLLVQENPALKLEWRHRTDRGSYMLRGSGTITSELTNTRERTGDDIFRGHLFGGGKWRLGDGWQTGFGVQLTTDDTYMRLYDISNDLRLVSNLYAERYSERSFFAAEGFFFQGLRSTDVLEETPIVAPLIQYSYLPRSKVLGGQVALDVNALVMTRLEGLDEQRLSAEARWDLPLSTRNGQQIRLGASLRGDLYRLTDFDDPTKPGTTEENETLGRLLPVVEVDWRWPFIRTSGRVSQVVEPIIQLVYSPYGGNPRRLPNEDSVSFEFDDTNLFSVNRFPGFDKWEDGPRANVGMRWALYGANGGSTSLLLGQTYRLDDADVFTDDTGLRGTRSDIVGRLQISPSSRFGITHRFRLDKDDLGIERNEVSAYGVTKAFTARVTYANLAAQREEQDLRGREEVIVSGTYRFLDYWSISGSTRRDLRRGQTINHGLGLRYLDECFQFQLNWQKSFTRDRQVKPSTSLTFRIALAYLG